MKKPKQNVEERKIERNGNVLKNIPEPARKWLTSTTEKAPSRGKLKKFVWV